MDIKNCIGRIGDHILALFPTQKKIVFVNFLGHGFGDSPKYIAEEIIRQALPYDLVWLVYDMNSIFPDGIRKVKFYSLRSRYELATARIIISNTKNRLPYVKKKSQYYIQTWHGGFGVKYIERDAEQYLPPKYVRESKYDSSITDLILSGSEFQTKVIEDSFWYDGEIFKKGVPRNDVLFRHSDFSVQQFKKKYGFSADCKIVLYAPTFRDDDRCDVYQLNTSMLLNILRQKTNTPWKLIIRLHPNSARHSNIFEYDDNVINGSIYPDAQELTIISDLLITDFSSIMMDFGIMRKPVMLFVTDLEDYIQKSRGIRPLFYKLPFELSQSNEELCCAIMNYDEACYQQQLKVFMDTYYHSYDDGHASEYVVERIKEKM